MVRIGKLADRSVSAVISDMNQPLGSAIGNALEVKEAISHLRGERFDRLTELSLELASEMLLLAGHSDDKAVARDLLESKLKNREALQTFGKLIEAQGGDARVIEDPSLLPQAEYVVDVKAPIAGYVHTVEPLMLGEIAMELGAGRVTKDTVIDLAVGLEVKRKVGDSVKTGETLVTIHANDKDKLAVAQQQVLAAFTIGDSEAPGLPLIYRRITTKDV